MIVVLQTSDPVSDFLDAVEMLRQSQFRFRTGDELEQLTHEQIAAIVVSKGEA
jgi:hypothetical protein